MSKEYPQLKIRIPETLKEKIISLAKKSKRSTNTEIIDLLERAINADNVNIRENNSALNQIIALVTNRATKIVEREQILSLLAKDERELISKLDMLPKQKKTAIITILMSLLKIL
jgi:hypothetical protein